MKKLTMITLSSLLLTTGSDAVAKQALAEISSQSQPSPSKGIHSFGVLDAQKVLQESKAHKDIRAQMEKFRQQTQAYIQKKETSLRKEEAEIMKKKREKKLTDEAFKKKHIDFQKKVGDLQSEVTRLKKKMEESIKDSMEKIQKSIQKTAEVVAKEQGFENVLLSGALITYSPKLDITDEVLTRHNKNLPAYKLSLPTTTN